ncbi:MAG: His-Xaa-Ser system radical SAM maturase HxsB, partial [Nitrososphaerales archaeon]
HIVLPREELHRFLRTQLPMHSRLYNDLKAKHFVIDEDSSIALELLAAKYRTKQSHLANFTALHMFVVTLRCEHSCPYCQVSRQSEDKSAFDMTEEMADRAIDFLFHSPSRSLKVEFQGGETLLNFPLIQYIVDQVERRNQNEDREIQFVIATNLALITDPVLQYCLEHDIYISTSLDGPRELHNKNRPRPGRDSYERVVDGIRRVREFLGPHKVSALMTTTVESLSQPFEIIDEYLRQGFHSIFLRSISPYGFAVKTGWANAYHIEEWLEFYKKGLDYIIGLNKSGVFFREEYSAIILRKLLTPFPTGYVDLQSPAGIGIAAIVFNYDGDVYASDEARMLAEMGDKQFRLGNLFEDTYKDIMGSPQLIETLLESMAEGVPCCSECAVQPYCGSDPVYHHAVQGDVVGYKPTSGFCRKNMEVIKHLVRLLEDDEEAGQVLKNWVCSC